MQADKCRTSNRSVKKELVIESPLRRKDAAQGEVEAEGPGPVLVRAVARSLSVVFSTECFYCVRMLSAFWHSGFKTCSACVS